MTNTKKETLGFGQLSINKQQLHTTPEVTINRFLQNKLLPLLSSASVNDKEKHNTSEWAIQYHTTDDRITAENAPYPFASGVAGAQYPPRSTPETRRIAHKLVQLYLQQLLYQTFEEVPDVRYILNDKQFNVDKYDRTDPATGEPTTVGTNLWLAIYNHFTHADDNEASNYVEKFKQHLHRFPGIPNYNKTAVSRVNHWIDNALEMLDVVNDFKPEVRCHDSNYNALYRTLETHASSEIALKVGFNYKDILNRPCLVDPGHENYRDIRYILGQLRTTLRKRAALVHDESTSMTLNVNIPSCSFCKKKGHTMEECRQLQARLAQSDNRMLHSPNRPRYASVQGSRLPYASVQGSRLPYKNQNHKRRSPVFNRDPRSPRPTTSNSFHGNRPDDTRGKNKSYKPSFSGPKKRVHFGPDKNPRPPQYPRNKQDRGPQYSAHVATTPRPLPPGPPPNHFGFDATSNPIVSANAAMLDASANYHIPVLYTMITGPKFPHDPMDTARKELDVNHEYDADDDANEKDEMEVTTTADAGPQFTALEIFGPSSDDDVDVPGLLYSSSSSSAESGSESPRDGNDCQRDGTTNNNEPPPRSPTNANSSPAPGAGGPDDVGNAPGNTTGYGHDDDENSSDDDPDATTGTEAEGYNSDEPTIDEVTPDTPIGDPYQISPMRLLETYDRDTLLTAGYQPIDNYETYADLTDASWMISLHSRELKSITPKPSKILCSLYGTVNQSYIPLWQASDESIYNNNIRSVAFCSMDSPIQDRPIWHISYSGQHDYICDVYNHAFGARYVTFDLMRENARQFDITDRRLFTKQPPNLPVGIINAARYLYGNNMLTLGLVEARTKLPIEPEVISHRLKEAMVMTALCREYLRVFREELHPGHRTSIKDLPAGWQNKHYPVFEKFCNDKSPLRFRDEFEKKPTLKYEVLLDGFFTADEDKLIFALAFFVTPDWHELSPIQRRVLRDDLDPLDTVNADLKQKQIAMAQLNVDLQDSRELIQLSNIITEDTHQYINILRTEFEQKEALLHNEIARNAETITNTQQALQTKNTELTQLRALFNKTKIELNAEIASDKAYIRSVQNQLDEMFDDNMQSFLAGARVSDSPTMVNATLSPTPSHSDPMSSDSFSSPSVGPAGPTSPGSGMDL